MIIWASPSSNNSSPIICQCIMKIVRWIQHSMLSQCSWIILLVMNNIFKEDTINHMTREVKWSVTLQDNKGSRISTKSDQKSNFQNHPSQTQIVLVLVIVACAVTDDMVRAALIRMTRRICKEQVRIFNSIPLQLIQTFYLSTPKSQFSFLRRHSVRQMGNLSQHLMGYCIRSSQ